MDVSFIGLGGLLVAAVLVVAGAIAIGYLIGKNSRD